MWKYNLRIIFAHRTFKWISESSHRAAFYCVVIRMADKNLIIDKKIFDNDKVITAQNINPYIMKAPKNIPKISIGSRPTEGGSLLLASKK